MDQATASTMAAVFATVIATASLIVAVQQAAITRKHNRQSVRPILEFGVRRRAGGVTGIQLFNRGPGPAIVTATTLSLDGELLGPWEEPTVNMLRESLRTRPRAQTLQKGRTVPAGFEGLLLYLDKYDYERDTWFYDLIRRRIRIEISYESIYGGEGYRVVTDNPWDGRVLPRDLDRPKPPRTDHATPPTSATAADQDR